MKMEETSLTHIESVVRLQKDFFLTHQSRSIDFRIQALKKLKSGIIKHEKALYEALWKDLRKSEQEAYLTEIALVIDEIDTNIKKIKRWAKPKRASTPIYALPSKGFIQHDPYGLALIIAPWNYPFQLLMSPLVGAISAGCTAILKPGEKAYYTAKVMEDIIQSVFDENYITVIQGAVETTQHLLKQPSDVIFFTGSPFLGKIVMKAASEHLTPVVLELGGKSPCIVDESANLKVAAKRIAWGKGLNSGQTCIAPDYLFVHESVKNEFLSHLKAAFVELFGDNIKQSPYYPRMIDEKSFERVNNLMQGGKVVYGGQTDATEKFIAPTVLENMDEESAVMQEEIFGPLLPLKTFGQISEVESYINRHEKPLALYYFGKESTAKSLINKTSSGGVCINDTVMHVSNPNLPFGGVGNSGMGNYHGQRSFEAFSHTKAVLSTPTWIDIPLKYPPFKYFKWIKKIL